MNKALTLISLLFFVSTYSFAVDDVKTESQRYNEKGLELIQEHEIKGAFEAFQKAIEADPNNKEAYKNLGLLYSWEQKYDDAIATFKKLIEVAPDYNTGYRNLVLIYNMMGLYEEAIPYGEKALELNPDDFAVMGYLVSAYVTVGEYKKTIKYSNRLIDRNPNRPRVYRFLAMAYDGLGEVEKAREAFEKSYNIVRGVSIYEDAPEKKRDVDSLFNEMRATTLIMRGDRYLQLGNEDKGIECYKKSLELNSNEVRAYYNLAKIYEIRGETDNVVVNLKGAIELDSKLLQQIMNSSDFDSIKDSEEFKNMFNEQQTVEEP